MYGLYKFECGLKFTGVVAKRKSELVKYINKTYFDGRKVYKTVKDFEDFTNSGKGCFRIKKLTDVTKKK